MVCVMTLIWSSRQWPVVSSANTPLCIKEAEAVTNSISSKILSYNLKVVDTLRACKLFLFIYVCRVLTKCEWGFYISIGAGLLLQRSPSYTPMFLQQNEADRLCEFLFVLRARFHFLWPKNACSHYKRTHVAFILLSLCAMLVCICWHLLVPIPKLQRVVYHKYTLTRAIN